MELEAIGAEGMEISVPARGSARGIVREMIKHLCSSISYGGADSLRGLREMFADCDAGERFSQTVIHFHGRVS